MSIVFDMYGNVIPSKINIKQKLSDEAKEILKEAYNSGRYGKIIPTVKTLRNETRTFFCKVHNRFHKHLRGNKPSQTYIKCLTSGNILKFLDDYTQSELFHMDFSKKWNKNKANYKRGN